MMGSHRRFISSGIADAEYLQPLHSYGGWFDITTNIREEQKAGGTVKGWLDYLVGGFESEDVAASPTVGGLDVRTGKPFDPGAAEAVAQGMNRPVGADKPVPCEGYPEWVPTWFKRDVLGCQKARPPVDPKKVAIAVSAVVAVGVLAYAYPKIKARYAAPKSKKK